MKKVLYQVASLSCAGCGKKIEDSLKAQDGIISVKVLIQLGKIRTVYDEAKKNSDQIEEIIRNLGYQIISKKIV